MQINSTTNINIKEYLTKQKSLIDTNLENIFAESQEFIHPRKLWDAVKYSLLNGGKRIRGILCLATTESISKTCLEDSLMLACIIEIIHSMSLIHDDLPALDNDDLRRGKLSCHKAFDEATAILAGDAMITMAFQLATEKLKTTDAEKKLEIIRLLSRTFTLGLVPGQILDLNNSGDISDINKTEKIYLLKTAELIKTAVLFGAIISFNNGVTNKEKVMHHLGNFGLKVGLAFQIIDDILDLTVDTKVLGKTSGKDKSQKKGTYPMIVGIEESGKIAKHLIEEAKLELRNLSIKHDLLFMLADSIINRIN